MKKISETNRLDVGSIKCMIASHLDEYYSETINKNSIVFIMSNGDLFK